MKTTITTTTIGVVAPALLLILSMLPLNCLAQGTAFTYQGRLNSGGNPATGIYDIQFTLYAVNVNGSAVAGPVTNSAVGVTNGLFTTSVDFGPDVFVGGNRWLDIAVRTNGSSTFTELTPRQFLAPVPNAIYAETASASGITGTIPAASLGGTYTNTINFDNGANNFDGTFVGSFYGGTFMGGNFTGNFFGNGGGLYNLNSSQLVGPVPNSVLGNAWLTTGNTGTSAGTNFVGTTDNQPLEFHANGQRILRLVPDNTTNSSPNIIAGSPVNYIAPGVVGSTISGGGGTIVYNNQAGTNQVLGDFNTIGGGWGNVTGSTNFNVVQATISGGASNTASGISSTIGGGADNVANNNDAVVAGGFFNRAGFRSAVGGGNGNTSDGAYVNIGGGVYNNIQTNSSFSVIGGGAFNTIAGTNYEAGNTIAGGENNVIQPTGYLDGRNPFGSGYPSSYSAIGGGFGNQVQTNSVYSVIAGGMQNTVNTGAPFSSIGGGSYNSIQTGGSETFIGGGSGNTIQYYASQATIAGGYNNSIEYAAWDSTIAGGYQNYVLEFASFSSIGGGSSNQAGGANSTVPGGYNNGAIGNNSFAAGTYAQATNDGSFVLTDDGLTNFYSTTSNQLSARFTGGVRFVTGGAGMTIDGQPVASGNGSTLTAVNALTLNGLSSTAFAPSSGSANYIQNQNSSPQPASFSINGSAQVQGLLRSGSESGTSEPPSPAGLVVRRINSTAITSNSVIALVHVSASASNITIVRDGSNGGIQIQYPASPGHVTITAMGMDSTGTERNVVTNLLSPSVAGVVQLYSDSQNIVHFECTFGDTYLNSGLTQVTLSRYNSDDYWSGNIISTSNQ